MGHVNPSRLKQALTPLFFVPLAQRLFYNNEASSLLEEVAELICDLLGPVEYTTSDILVGLLLVMKAQTPIKRLFISSYSNSYNAKYPAAISCNLEHEQFIANIHMDPKLIAYFMNYAEAIYGFPLFMFANFFPGLRHLCCPCTSSKPRSAIEATRLSLNSNWAYGCLCCFPAAWIRNPPMHPDIVYDSTEGQLFKSPFFVSIDHKMQALVIAIRGTMSTSDLLADLLFREQTISWTERGQMFSTVTHHGVYQIAKNIWNELVDHQIIEQYVVDAPYAMRNYRIITTGHSLGGAVASLLAFIMKNDSRYPQISSNIFAFCYSTPGTIIGEEGLEYFKTFCTSTVLGDDFVCRLSPKNVNRLKNDIIWQLESCELRKIDVLSNALFSYFLAKNTSFDIIAVERGAEDAPETFTGVSTFIPGNVLHLIELPVTNNSSDCLLSNDGKKYSAFWIDNRSFDRIFVTKTMGYDHLPNVLSRRIEEALQ